jgi:hypothetical protein
MKRDNIGTTRLVQASIVYYLIGAGAITLGQVLRDGASTIRRSVELYNVLKNTTYSRT